MGRDLETATLGRTGLEVTRLAYGGAAIAEVAEDVAERILNLALDAGMNLIDTAVDYGRSEEFIGKFVSHRRSEFYLASKCGCSVPKEPERAHEYTRENIVAGVEQSLSRMSTDYLDLVQLHSSLAEETLLQYGVIETLEELRSQGKVRFIGSSSTLPNIDEHIGMGVFDEFQIPYSALKREHEGVIARCAAAGAGTVIRGGVSQGAPGDGKGIEATWDAFDGAKLDELCEEGESRSAFVLRFALAHPNIDTVIVGTTSPAHLQENVETALRGPLPADTYAEAKRRLDALTTWNR